jgi:three-Cys-motif partner protein
MQFDEVNYWTEIKLDIVKDYAQAYSTIFHSEKQSYLKHVYIDAFAGAGVHISRASGQFIPGSPLNAFLVQPAFRDYHFIDLDGAKIAHLKRLVGERSDVHVHHGDCNQVLLDEVFPKILFKDYRRGLCLLDPYGLHLNWQVIQQAGQMKSIELFLNFPIMDMNRNALWRNPEKLDAQRIARMTAFWGDESWQAAAYQQTPTLFGVEDEKTSNDAVAEAFRSRLKTVAGFAKVPQSLPMRNRAGAVVYYLFFASHKPVAEGIVSDIFKKYQHRGAP